MNLSIPLPGEGRGGETKGLEMGTKSKARKEGKRFIEDLTLLVVP